MFGSYVDRNLFNIEERAAPKWQGIPNFSAVLYIVIFGLLWGILEDMKFKC